MPVRIPAIAVFADVPDADAARQRLLDTQQSDQPVNAWLLPRDNPGLEPFLVENHWWQLGLIVDGNGNLAADMQVPMEAWIRIRTYIEGAVCRGYELVVWLDSKESKARGLLTDVPSGHASGAQTVNDAIEAELDAELAMPPAAPAEPSPTTADAPSSTTDSPSDETAVVPHEPGIASLEDVQRYIDDHPGMVGDAIYKKLQSALRAAGISRNTIRKKAPKQKAGRPPKSGG